MPLCPNGFIFLAFYVPSQIFLWESCKAVAWWEHCYPLDKRIGFPSIHPLFSDLSGG